jgi:transposase
MPDGKVWVGLDLGERRISLCAVNDAGEPLLEQECASDCADVKAALSVFASTTIGLVAVEAGTNTRLVRTLRSRGYPVGIFEARKASKFLAIRRSKSDGSDAHGLADLARLGRHTVSQVYLKSEEFQHLRSELALRHKLIKIRVAVEGSLRSRFASYGQRLPAPRSASGLRKSVQAATDTLLAEGVDVRAHLEPLVRVAESLRTYLTTLDKTLEQRAKDVPVCQRFMEIPGVGWVRALLFYTAIEDPTRFDRSEDVGAYLGLVPRRYQSGEVSRTLGITKTGSKPTRQHLVTAAMVMRTRKVDCALRDWGMALKDRIGGGRSRVAMALKLAVIMLCMWKSGARFEPYPDCRAAQRVEEGGAGSSLAASAIDAPSAC